MLIEIVEATRRRLDRDGVVIPVSSPPARDFKTALEQPGLQVIAEFKRRSPSAGPLGMAIDPAVQAAAYERGGAAAISVLTEPDYFSGSISDLAAVRAAVDLPILRKDFIIDERQVAESRAIGADAMLLIVAALEVVRLESLLSEARNVGIAALVEAHNEAEARMKGAIQALEEDLGGIRTGRASPALIERLSIDYYGTATPLIQLASIGVPEPRTLLIRPFDPGSLKTIERSILASDLGLTPNNDGKTIRLNLPPLTQERRQELSKIVHNRVEEARIAVRNVRRDSIKDLREFENEKMISEDDLKRGEEELQKITDDYIKEINETGDRKEVEVMEV